MLHFRVKEDNNRLIDFKWAHIRKKKTQGREASYKIRSKFLVIFRNIQHFTGTVP